jgi:phage baseplate assembly protein W
MNPISNRIGKGLKWPIELVNGSASLVANIDLLKQNVKLLLNWPRYTRFYLGEYATDIETLLEEPNDSLLLATLKDNINSSVKKWEPNVTVIDVAVFRKGIDGVVVNLTYKITNTNLVDNFNIEF